MHVYFEVVQLLPIMVTVDCSDELESNACTGTHLVLVIAGLFRLIKRL